MLTSLDGYTRIPGARPRVGVLASGSGSNLGAIAAAIAAGDLEVELAAVVCNVAGAGALERARRAGVEPALIEHGGFGSRADFDAAVVAALRERGVEWVVMAGWMRLVGVELLDAFGGRVLNIHPSLLPSFKGLRAIEQALAAGVGVTGCTVHEVTEGVDSGPIVAQAAVVVDPGDDARTLHARVQRAEHVLYPRAISAAIARRRARDER